MARPVERRIKLSFDGWSPRAQVRQLLDDPSLKTRDKIELVIVAYSLDHGGNAPSMAEIASILNITKVNVQHAIDQLIAQNRASRVDGKLVIAESVYSHPLIKRLRR
jgi:hypothetical protein